MNTRKKNMGSTGRWRPLPKQHPVQRKDERQGTWAQKPTHPSRHKRWTPTRTYSKIKQTRRQQKWCESQKKQSLHSMVTPWPLHTWGLDLVRPVNAHSQGYIWILMATEYFTKWIGAIPLRKAIGGTMANFTKENIIVWFGVPHRILSEGGTPFVNRHVRKMLEFYQVKHHW